MQRIATAGWVLLLGGILLAGTSPVAAQACDPSACGGSPPPSAAGSAGGDTVSPGDTYGLGTADPYDISSVLRSGVVNGVVDGARWLGDYYGRTYPAVPAGQTQTAPREPAAPPPTVPANDPDDPPLANSGWAAGQTGNTVARGAWQLGTWAGSTPPPQLGPGPAGGDEPPSPAAPPSAGNNSGIWTQPLVKSAPDTSGPRFK